MLLDSGAAPFRWAAEKGGAGATVVAVNITRFAVRTLIIDKR